MVGMLAGKGRREGCRDKTGIKRAVRNKVTTNKVERSQVDSVNWSSWPQRDLLREATCLMRSKTTLD